jgi:hypothetical protein
LYFIFTDLYVFKIILAVITILIKIQPLETSCSQIFFQKIL